MTAGEINHIPPSNRRAQHLRVDIEVRAPHPKCDVKDQML
jgi:hypothetical protein